MTGGEVVVSVVLPAHDEEVTIERAVRTTVEALEAFLSPEAFEVIVAEDGCDDRTPAIASRLAAEDDRVRHVHGDERLGRGEALERAFRASRGGTLAYVDADLATDPRHLEALVESVRSGPYDVATGSRLVPGHRASRPARRAVPSRTYNALVRAALGSEVYDHQCGFKAFDREALFDLLEGVGDDHWFWDTEVLVRAQRAGHRVGEFPVDWTPRGDTAVDPIRDVLGMGNGLVRAWWGLVARPRITPRVTLVTGALLALLAVVLTARHLDPRAVLAGVAAAHPALLAIAALVYCCSWPIRGVRYRTILAELGFRERTGFLTAAIFVSQTGNLAFPARAGDAIRAYVLKARRGIGYPSGFASLAIERVFDLLAIALLAGAVLAGFAATGTALDTASVAGVERGAFESGRIAVPVAAGVAVAAVVAVGVVASARRGGRLRSPVSDLGADSYAHELAGAVERFAADVERIGDDPRAFARVAASSVSVWAVDAVTAAVVLWALGVPPSLSVIALTVLAVSVGNLAKVLPLSPGGIGLYEGAFTLVVVALSPIGPGVALGAAILDHAIKNAVTILGGLASTAALEVSLSTAVEEGRVGERTVSTDR